MLNISKKSINQEVEFNRFSAAGRMELSTANSMFVRWLMGTLLLVLIFLFLPWTQNIQSRGEITTVQPGQRPQTIQSTIAGRIEQWFVQEGQLVKKGDTIVFLSEIKAEYFDPDLVSRTLRQVTAKEGAMGAYEGKAVALDEQIEAMKTELGYKQQQLENRILQAQLKLASDEADLSQAYIQDSIARQQYDRAQRLFLEGINSRTKVEDRQGKLQETAAKLMVAKNKVGEARNEVLNAQLQLNTVLYEYNQKIAKAESERFSTLSMIFDAEGSINKLNIEASNYSTRSQFYYIVAPQDSYITEVIKPGIGETVKEGEGIVTIMPADYQLAVQLYVRPMDLPLISVGREVRFIFDGWPAFIFSGWPGQSFGTYSGEVFAIDRMISPNGRYRILVAPGEEDKPWPEALQVGSGAQGIALLTNVPLWYEIWRRLNGFPPEYYYDDKDVKEEELKMKAPAKSIK